MAKPEETKDSQAANIAISAGVGPVAVLSGRLLEKYASAMAPTPEELRGMLRRLIAVQQWPQAYAAEVFGVSRSGLIKWLAGERHPSGPAAKWIFFLHETLVKQRPVSVGSLVEWRIRTQDSA